MYTNRRKRKHKHIKINISYKRLKKVDINDRNSKVTFYIGNTVTFDDNVRVYEVVYSKKQKRNVLVNGVKKLLRKIHGVFRESMSDNSFLNI